MFGTTKYKRHTYGWHEAMTNKLLTDGSPVSLRLSVADQPLDRLFCLVPCGSVLW